MYGTQRSRWAGLAAVLGGGLCGIAGTRLALRPPGIPGGAYRNSDDVTLWIIIGLALIVVGMIGMYLQHAGRTGLLGKIGVGLAIVGVTLMACGSVVGWSVFAVGYLSVVASLVVFGIAILFAAVYPFWVSTLICLTAGCLVLFNTEDARAWLLVPFGLIWVILGYIVWTNDPASHHAVRNA